MSPTPCFVPAVPPYLAFPTTKSAIRPAKPPQRRPLRTPRAALPPPPSPDPPASPDHDENLHWKDRVALYAQFSAEETLTALLKALRENTCTGPHKDDGIDALYAFANLDIWALSHRFFGRTMDLGQFERFKRVVVAHPYDVLLSKYESRTLSAIHVTDDVYVTRRAFAVDDNQEKVFTFTMSQNPFGAVGSSAWMVDSIIYEP